MEKVYNVPGWANTCTYVKQWPTNYVHITALHTTHVVCHGSAMSTAQYSMQCSCAAMTDQCNATDEEEVRMSAAFRRVIGSCCTKNGSATEEGQNDGCVDQQSPTQEDKSAISE